MYLINAPEKKFGVLPPGYPLICNEVKFTSNVALCHQYYWKKTHCSLGCVDITPPEIKKLREARKLKNIVVFATGGIGDSMWVMPIVRALREKHPQSCISVVTDPRSGEIWKHCPFINGILESGAWTVHGIMQKADEILDFGGIATVYKDLMKMEPVEATFKIAGLPIPADRKKMRPYIQLTLTEGQNAQKQLEQNKIYPERDKIISIGIEASTCNRNWPYSYTAKLSKLLSEKGYKIIWLGKSRDMQTPGINELAQKHNILNLTAKTSIRQAFAIIGLSDLYIGPNSSLMVAATALEVPCIGLFGAFDPKRIGKYYDKFLGVWGNMKCAPCNEHWTECRHGHPAPCMKMIMPEKVFDYAENMLAKFPREIVGKLPIE